MKFLTPLSCTSLIKKSPSLLSVCSAKNKLVEGKEIRLLSVTRCSTNASPFCNDVFALSISAIYWMLYDKFFWFDDLIMRWLFKSRCFKIYDAYLSILWNRLRCLLELYWDISDRYYYYYCLFFFCYFFFSESTFYLNK